MLRRHAASRRERLAIQLLASDAKHGGKGHAADECKDPCGVRDVKALALEEQGQKGTHGLQSRHPWPTTTSGKMLALTLICTCSLRGHCQRCQTLACSILFTC